MTLEKSRQLELAALYYNNHSTNSKNKILLGEDIGCNGYGSSDDYKQCLTKINDIFDIREHKVTEYLSQEQETYTSLKNNLLVVKLPGGSWDQSCSTEVNNKDFYFDGVTLQDSCPIAKGNQSNIMPISIGICNNTIIENHDGYLACQAYNDIGHTDSDVRIGINNRDWHIFLKEKETSITDNSLTLITRGLTQIDYGGQKTFILPNSSLVTQSVVFDSKTNRYFYLRVNGKFGFTDSFITVGCIQGDPFCTSLAGGDHDEFAQIQFKSPANINSSNVNYRVDAGGASLGSQIGVLHRILNGV